MIIDQSSVTSQLNQLCAREDISRCHLELERLGYACWYVSIGQWCKSRRKQSTLCSIKVWKIKLLSKLRAAESNCNVFFPIRLARWFNKTNWARNTPSFLMSITRWSALQIWVILFWISYLESSLLAGTMMQYSPPVISPHNLNCSWRIIFQTLQLITASMITKNWPDLSHCKKLRQSVILIWKLWRSWRWKR